MCGGHRVSSSLSRALSEVSLNEDKRDTRLEDESEPSSREDPYYDFHTERKHFDEASKHVIHASPSLTAMSGSLSGSFHAASGGFSLLSSGYENAKRASLVAESSFKTDGENAQGNMVQEVDMSLLPMPHNQAGANSGWSMDKDALEEEILPELKAIYASLRKCIELRHKYLGKSLQREGDNPKDDDSQWEVYPPLPPPAWQPESVDGKPQAFVKPAMEGLPGENFDFAKCAIPEREELNFDMDTSGVYQVLDEKGSPLVDVPTLKDYYLDLEAIHDASSEGPAKSFAFRRLQYLEVKWNSYTLLNEFQELADTKRVPHRDFYNVRKVDTHVHHSACMNQKHLLRFIKAKLKKAPDEVVIFRDGKYLTLQEVFDSLNLTSYDLSIDTLDMHAHKDSFHRFDKFNLKYNPIGESRLRTVFLKTDNDIQGRYLADITREVFTDLEQSKYQMAEYRISIYGRSEGEWDKLAAWVIDNKLYSHNVRWLIQVPRLYNLYKETRVVDNFSDVIRNIFKPLFEVTQDPSSHPKLHVFLQRVIGFDSVDDESKSERRLYRKFPLPKQWDTRQNPPYSYWIYYMYANMATLNAWRQRRKFNTFVLRPHCGEAGDTDHLAATFLTSHSISHGIQLRKTPFLQYLFYLDQIGLAMSPLSNNALFLAYDKNPFVSFFKKGLNVSISTDDPLMFHFTKEPLIEEYSIATQIYRLSSIDTCELARNSVTQSGFELEVKKRWLGNDLETIEKTNVPLRRTNFRRESLKEEWSMIGLQA
jgi:AMP deaminase